MSYLTACGNDTGAGSDDGESVIGFEQIPELYSTTLCQAFESCLGPLLALLPEDCETKTQMGFEDGMADLEDAIDDGRVVYNGNRVQACLDDLLQVGCEIDTAEPSAACEDVLAGTLEIGEDCVLDEECRGFAFCKSDASCPGTCTELGSDGDDCGENSHCGAGLVCSDFGDCVQPAGPGDLCGGDNEPECELGLLCLGQDEEAGTPGNCRTLEEAFSAEEGESCGDSVVCESGLACALQSFDADTGELDFRCEPVVGSGNECRVAFPDECPPNEFCSLDPESPEGMMLRGQCVARPGEGQACGVAGFDEEGSVCASYTRCQAGTCVALQPLGGGCQSDDICLSSSCVNGRCAGGACE